jgi:hypothetical protein
MMRSDLRHLRGRFVRWPVPSWLTFRPTVAQIAEAARDLQSENFARLRNELNRNIYELVNSIHSSDKLGGILAIGTSLFLPLSCSATASRAGITKLCC